MKLRRRFALVLLLCAAQVWADEMPAPSPGSPPSPPPAPVQTGIDVLVLQNFSVLAGKQVGLITNQTGVDSHGRSTADILARAKNVKLVAIFSPEHGIRGRRQAGETVGDTIDPVLHLPVYSLYGPHQKPTPEMLNAIDILVFDMQDVGSRFYTYITTMGMAMEAATQRGIPFVVLDRPNPVGGDVIEGPILEKSIHVFTAYFQIPPRHGLTTGELALWYNKTSRLNAKLQVIPMVGWARRDLWWDTGLNFVPPSPNIRTPIAALLYSGIGMFEATNLSVGRGTDSPFELVGAPWVDGRLLEERLNALNIPGVQFAETNFLPTQDLYDHHLCAGVRMHVTDPRLIRPVELFVQISCVLREMAGKDFELRWDEIARVTGTHDFEELYKTGHSAAEIIAVFKKSADQFSKERQPYLLYQ